jgi:hypothetical protein
METGSHIAKGSLVRDNSRRTGKEAAIGESDGNRKLEVKERETVRG